LDTDSPNRQLNGLVSHTAVWDVGLSVNEIVSLANGHSPLKVRRSNLVSYAPLNGQSPEPDIVGGLNLTVNGSPAVAEEPPIPDSIKAGG